jgi:hypothetical protein
VTARVVGAGLSTRQDSIDMGLVHTSRYLEGKHMARLASRVGEYLIMRRPVAAAVPNHGVMRTANDTLLCSVRRNGNY